jgi:hypothetical protein
MTTLNNGILIQNKTGGIVAPFINDNTFFTVEETSSIFDPKVFYDKYAGRYYFIDLDRSGSISNILLAVSQTNDPTGAWNQYRFQANVGETNIWFDYPMVGYNKDWIVIGGNMFTVSGGSFSKAKLFVINKSDVLAGSATTPTEINPTGSTLSPAIVGDNTTNYIPLVCRWNSGNGTYKLFQITGSPASPVLSDIGFPSVGSANSWLFGSNISNDGPKKDMTSQTNGLATNDSRMGQSLLKNGKLWVAHTAFLSNVVSGATIYRGTAQ